MTTYPDIPPPMIAILWVIAVACWLRSKNNATFGQQFWSPKLSYRKINIYYSDAEFNVEYDGTIRLHSKVSIDGDIIV